MKIATWNVNGIRAREQQVVEWLQATQPDVVCLQEVKASPEQVPASLKDLEGYWSLWHGAKGYSGVALLVAKSFCEHEPVFDHPGFNMECRIVTALIGEITVASIYAPNGGKDFEAKLRFLAALEQYAADMIESGAPLILCGDLNVARLEIDVHPKERRQVIGQLPIEREWFARLLGGGLVDLGRVADPNNEELFTWWAPWRQMKQRNIGWRLDYLLATAPLATTLHSCVVQREIGTSDHGPVVAVLG